MTSSSACLSFLRYRIIALVFSKSHRYCDYCGKYLKSPGQQWKIERYTACIICEKKYRVGKISAEDIEYTKHILKTRE